MSEQVCEKCNVVFTLDKGEEGILYSVNYWKNKNIVFSGQSSSYEERSNIKVYEQNGIKYAFLDLIYKVVSGKLCPEEILSFLISKE